MRGKAQHWIAAGLLGLAVASAASGQNASDGVIDRARRQVTVFFNKMSDLTCMETVMQQKIRGDGHVEATAQSRYDYLIMVQASRDDFSMNESRIEAANAPRERLPMLVTNGFSMLLLVFHPYYQESFRLREAPEERPDGSGPMPVHFTHIPNTRSPAALELRGREYPLDLEGTAWIDPQSGEVEKIDADLGHDMSDLGLRSLRIHVEYKATTLRGTNGMPLPDRAVIDVETPRQHWRNTHVFSEYKSFSTAAQQDTSVKVIEKDKEHGDGGTGSEPAGQGTTPNQEER